jgi:hypothetical protein
MTSHTREGKGLTAAQHKALQIASNDYGGVAGSGWYRSEWLGGRVVTRGLNCAGYVEPHQTVGAGLLYRVTSAGRLALSQSLDAGEVDR